MYYDEIGVPTRQISAENPTGEKGAACRVGTPDPGEPRPALQRRRDPPGQGLEGKALHQGRAP